MKKLLSFLVLSLAAVFIYAQEVVVAAVNGKVEVQEAGEWIPLEEGDEVVSGSVISTGFNSSAVFKIFNSELTLGPLTRLTVDELVSTAEKDSTLLYIDSGTLKAQVKGYEGKAVGFKVTSPAATASVRGTGFVMTAGGRIFVTEGLVSFGAPEKRKGLESVEEKPAEEKTEVAEVASTSDSDNASTTASPAEKKPVSTVFTSSAEVGGFSGVPVYQGQASKTDIITGSQSAPVKEKISAAVGISNSTQNQSNSEAVSTSAISSGASGSSVMAAVEESTGAKAGTANVKVHLTLKK